MPYPSELDELLGFPQGYTEVEGVTELQREQLIGNTMHTSVIQRLLQDLPQEAAAKPKPESGSRNTEGTSYAAPQQSTVDILEHIWDTLQEDPFKEVDATAIDAEKYEPPEINKTIRSDVPLARPDASPPKAFRTPEVENLSTWEYLKEVWDFEKNECKIPWGGKPQPPATVEAALDHMHDMGDDYGQWLETQLKRWEDTAAELRKANPQWRDKCHKAVAAVLPPEYHPDVHAAMLDAAGAESGIVKRALRGSTMAGAGQPTGFFDALPSVSAEKLKSYDAELRKV